MKQSSSTLDYAPQRARTSHTFGVCCLVAADCLVLLLVFSLLSYPDGASGSFFAPPAYLAVPVALIASIAGIAYSAVLDMKYHRIGLAMIVFVLSLIPLPMFIFGYHLIESYKHFNFGPG